jgi:RNA polymerase sigma-70 factor (ECF subfamily)
MLESSETSVNSALQRARSSLEGRLSSHDRERAPLPRSPEERELVGRFADAFESGDVAEVVALLTEDAALTMPPDPFLYQGRVAIARFLSTVPAGGKLERFRLVATRANDQPAFGFYLRDPHSPIARAAGVMVLTLAGGQVSAITAFHDTSVFPYFGLPRMLPEA